MSAVPASTPTERPKAGAIRVGFALAALLDATASLALAPEARLGPLLMAVAFAAFHVLALGLLLSAAVGLAESVLPRRRALASALVLAVGFPLGWGVFVEDFSVFPAWLRAALTLAVATAFAVVPLLWARVVRSPLLRGLAVLVALAAVAANQLVLDGFYPGIHLVTHLAVGVFLGLAVSSPSAGERAAAAPWRRRAGVALLGVASLGAAASVVLPPSNAVLVVMARMPTASLVPFLARVRSDVTAGDPATIAREARAWFASRADEPPIPPSTPPLLRGKPLVIFLTVDALRADVVLGDDPRAVAATKHLRALAARGANFTMARTTASSTSPAISTIFTGKYYSSLHWTAQDYKNKSKYFIGEEPTPRFPELLSARGVACSFLPTATGFLEEFGLTRGMKPLSETVVAGAEHALPHLLRWVDEAPPGPAMVWTHLLDPHAPYARGERGASSYERYLAEVAFVDEQLQALVAHVEQRGLGPRTYFVISADHGEAFGEHGSNYHASTIYEEQVRVPLVIVGPRVVARAIDEPVSVIDLGATLLDLFGVETPGHWMGQSLVPLLAGRDVILTRPIVLDAGRRKQGIVSRDGIKAIRNLREATREAYDLRADPQEAVNLLDTEPDRVASRLDEVAAFFRVHERTAPGYEIPHRE